MKKYVLFFLMTVLSLVTLSRAFFTPIEVQEAPHCGMWPPRIDRCWVKDELVQLVREELENRTDYDVIFFRTERYSDYGVPMFQIEHHYFSSYD